LKRVERIPSILERLERPVRWVHFGDGPARAEVERAATELPPTVDWTLKGSVERNEILEFYRANRVNVFLSVSSTEGLPFSIMEAISFGVPVVATDVGGVPEIVSAETGFLVGIDDSAAEIAAALARVLDGEGPRVEETLRFFESNFDAEINFRRFAAILAVFPGAAVS
jgi:glycosyltransferase involved in cell wall biosynthesis